MIKYISLKTIALLLMGMCLVSCERDLSDDAEIAPYPNTPDIFTDDFVGMGTNFYFPFLDAKADVFSVDREMGFESNASVRIDVPSANDPAGAFVGAIFRVEGFGRDLTEYDALTFYARASQSTAINELGFGVDFGEDRYAVRRFNLGVTPSWQKFVIPIPDASFLTEERGMMVFADGGIGTPGQEVGYTLWFDEIKFERLGTIGQSRPAINGGQVSDVTTFVGGSVQVGGFSHTLNVDGQDVTVFPTIAYYQFSSSDPSVATVDANGLVSIVGTGEATITASVNGVEAAGALRVSAEGAFPMAPVPSQDPNDVISIFSDAYDDRPASYISNFGGQTSTLSPFEVGGDNILFYQNVNFFGIQFNGNVDLPLIDGSNVTTLHIDVLVLNDIAPGSFLNVALRDAGPNGEVETDIFTGQPIGDDSQVEGGVPIQSGQWVSLDLNISGLNQQSALAQIAINSPDAGPNEFYVDNIYFY